MIKQLHLAAQYLATMQISFLEKKDDDSHTNLGFNSELGQLETWSLNSTGLKLCLNYETFSLGWNDDKNDFDNNFTLDGKSHVDVIEWLEKNSKSYGLIGKYHYDLHYDLPYEIADDYSFKVSDKKKLVELMIQRALINNVLEQVLQNEGLDSDIRIWPHHFDSGAFSALTNREGVSVGFGLALPDTLIDDFYYYISGYKGHDAVSVENFSGLTRGNWMSENFSGATLAAAGISEDGARLFFTEAISAYKG